MNKKILGSLFLALPMFVGCISEFHSDECDSVDPIDDDPADPNGNGGNNGGNNGGGCPDPATSIYLGTTAVICESVTFTCPENYTSFNASCGCGCEEIPDQPPACPEEGEGVTFLSRDLKVCTSIGFTCPEGSSSFNAACGCGCVADAPPAPVCPDRNDPKVHYLGDPGTAQCTMIAFQCPAECVQFNDSCGCGCIEP